MNQQLTEGASPSAPRLLHLGCGLTAPAEWVNVDGSSNAWLAQHPILKSLVKALHIFPRSQFDIPWPTNIRIANLTKRLPFADASFDGVFSSHTLEHLFCDEALALLNEARRVLKPGGRCRTLVPDLQSLVKEYLGQGTVAGMEGVPGDDVARRFITKLLMRNQSRAKGLRYRILGGSDDLHSHKWMYDGASLIRLMTKAGFVDCRVRGFRDSDIRHIDKVESAGRVLNGAGVVVEGVKPA